MPVASCVGEMEMGASESLLEAYRRRSRRFRRRIRRKPSRTEEDETKSGASGGVEDPADNDEPVVNLNDAIHDGDDPDVDEVAQEVADGDISSDWSLDKIERAQNVDRLEQILLAENERFHLHC